jgi:CRISPR-associated protein Cas1
MAFFHRMHNSFQALIYDIIEPFRWLVEFAVYKIELIATMNIA